MISSKSRNQVAKRTKQTQEHEELVKPSKLVKSKPRESKEQSEHGKTPQAEEPKPVDEDVDKHIHACPESFKQNPPIPIFNFIIDNVTLEIIQDKTGSA